MNILRSNPFYPKPKGLEYLLSFSQKGSDACRQIDGDKGAKGFRHSKLGTRSTELFMSRGSRHRFDLG